MKASADNPAGNSLPPSIRETDLVEGIRVSGYPLQGRVAQVLLPQFTVVEEWGYIDDDTGVHRSLDLFAHRAFGHEGAVRPATVLLIECKRATAPYVFFQTVGLNRIPDFPVISGMWNWDVSVSTVSGKGSRSVTPAVLLGLEKHGFVEGGVPVCSAFSKAVPNGKHSIELSGTDPYNSAILPLVKATRHARTLYRLGGPQHVIFPTLILAICVLDAPMVLVEGPESATDPVLRPWVRVIRREAVKETHAPQSNRYYAIDFVHAGYFDRFVGEDVGLLMADFEERTAHSGAALMYGATVPQLDAWDWKDVRPKPKP